ncbi:acetylcholine receptor subunit alpha-1-B-like [Ylistrum balloti]|uniref:acetylcholine receptor subunit alpha-1-B-like n=1 Tax=Ylistrum balloti TaxID=509963 RepID=UPI002905A9F3|nr:acetylcholine receptor subunit alpha-1-B-like [Ylistrum balloti]
MPSICGIDWSVFNLLLFLIVGITGSVRADTSKVYMSKEKQLIKKLLDRYERYGRVGRPVVNTSDSILVHFGMSLIQILNVDEKNQVLETNVWFTYTWKDVMLTWNASEHENIQTVHVPHDRVWLPDIVLYNFADPRLKEQREALVVVESTGDVLWMPQAILRSSCQFDTTYFPFDEQKCILKFGSWTYDGKKLGLQFQDNLKKFSLADYMKGTEWTITENYAVRSEKFYECCPDTPYPDLTFKLSIKRKVAFYSFILILPCALLSTLTLVIFWVPPESPAKLVLGMNVFVAFFVLLLLLADSTPKAADSIPLIGAYFCLSMVMITMSTVLSTIVANMFFRGVRINRAPAWLRKFMIDIVARAFMIRDKLIEKQAEPPQKNSWNIKYTGGATSKLPETEMKFAKVRLLDEGKEDGYEQNNKDCNIERLNIIRSSLSEDIRIIREILEAYRDKKAKAEQKEKFIREWKVICCITDRLFFLMYLVVNVIGIVIIFFASDLYIPEKTSPTQR